MCTQEVPGAVLAAVLADRLVFASQRGQNTDLHAHPVGLLEPLLLGQLAHARRFAVPRGELAGLLARLTARFDSTRVSRRGLQALVAAGFPDLAWALASSSPLLPPSDKARLAIQALRLEDALQPSRDRDGPEQSLRIATLAQHYGQLEVARRALEAAAGGGDSGTAERAVLLLARLLHACANRGALDALLQRIRTSLPTLVPAVGSLLATLPATSVLLSISLPPAFSLPLLLCRVMALRSRTHRPCPTGSLARHSRTGARPLSPSSRCEAVLGYASSSPPAPTLTHTRKRTRKRS